MRVDAVAVCQVAVLVPAVEAGSGRRKQFHEPDTTFYQAACQQALFAELFRHLVVQAVEVFGGFRLLRKIQKFRHRRLHAEREFIVADGGVDFTHLAEAGHCAFVQLCQKPQFLLLGGNLRSRRRQVGNRVLALTEDGPLVAGRQEAAGETIEASRRDEAAFQHNETRQVLAL